MKTRKILSAVLAFVSFVVMSGCTPETSVISNSENEVTVSSKANIEKTETEKITEATEATTVYCTKDGITLENAPKLKINTSNIGESPTYPVIINSEKYLAEPWYGRYRKEGTEETVTFDTFTINTVDIVSDIDMYYTAIINGVEYGGETLEQQRELNTAIKEKYPNFTFSIEENDDIPQGYTINLSNAEEIKILINKPNTRYFTFVNLTLNLSNINNSAIYSTFPNTSVETSGTITNSMLYYSCQTPQSSTFNYNALKNCFVYNYVEFEPQLAKYRQYINLIGGQDNTIAILLKNATNSSTVNIGGAISTWVEVGVDNSSVEVLETLDNPNFNSQIILYFTDSYDTEEDTSEETKALEKSYQEQVIKDLSNRELSVGVNTNDLDNTPVYVSIPWANITAEVQTGGLYGEISTDFLLNAPTDGSVYNFGE
jgi:hypothetical protein